MNGEHRGRHRREQRPHWQGAALLAAVALALAGFVLVVFLLP